MITERRVLIVSKHFLNESDPQAQQTLRVAQQLLGRGVKVDVVCGRWGSSSSSGTWMEYVYPVSCGWIPSGSGGWSKIARKIYKNLVGINPCTRWARGAQRQIKILKKARRYTAVISFALPLESHLPALITVDGVPWIAYFSDPWPESVMPKPYSAYAMPVLGALNKLVIRRILRRCTHAVFPTQGVRDLISTPGSEIKLESTSILPHIAHPASRKVRRARSPAKFTIVHVGGLGRDRASRELVEAVRMLPEEERPILRFIGKGSEWQRRFAVEAGMGRYFEFVDWVDPENVPSSIEDCSALLLVEAPMDSSPYLPSKLSDYAYYGLPILAITPSSSAVEDAIIETGAGCVTVNSASKIVEALRAIRSGQTHCGFDRIRARFSTERTADAWCEILDQLNKQASADSRVAISAR